ncbi:MAG: M48 family metalloprotease [Desulfopila sp.]|jgi:putative metalloprotease|nr:M48 family metalloprotease [Desulfopila sp.]
MKRSTSFFTVLSSAFRYLILFLLLVLNQGCEDTNFFLLTEAGLEAVNAITLSDEDVHAIAAQAAAVSDSKHMVAPVDSVYSRRLKKLVTGYEEHDGVHFDFKVYLTEEINAFAMADGTIRVFSGLMDLLSDEELLFVVGHEMGHVVKKHSRRQVVLAYASSALRKGLASQQNQIGEIARSAVGALAQQLANAQFSQYEEKQADNYGAIFLQNQGLGIEPAVSALEKLAQLAREHTLLSSHPEPQKRSERLASGAYKNDLEDLSFFANLLQTLKKWFVGLLKFIVSYL